MREPKRFTNEAFRTSWPTTTLEFCNLLTYLENIYGAIKLNEISSVKWPCYELIEHFRSLCVSVSSRRG